jgi:glycosyltransferase involved in cell wall biosynthesis
MASSALQFARQSGIPSVLTIHCLPTLASMLFPDLPGLRAFVEHCLWRLGRRFIRRFDMCVTPTSPIADAIAAHTGIRPGVISGGVDLGTFRDEPLTPQDDSSLRAGLGIPARAQVILHTGRLDTGKNVPAIIRAAAQAIKVRRKESTFLLVVGDGRERQQLIQLAGSLGISENFCFPGFISDPVQLSSIYRLADLFVMASEIETQGLVLLEAAACGLPIVAVRATATDEIVSDGVNGFLVTPGDTSQMAQRMIDILDGPELSARMSAASLRAAQAHDFNRTVDAYEDCYLAAVRALALGSREKGDAKPAYVWSRG